MSSIKLEGVNNVRDLGGIPLAGARVVAPGLFFRGSVLNNATDTDLALLFGTDAAAGQLGCTHIIDVRTGWEREAKSDRLVAGVENLHIPFYDLEKVGIEYTEPAAGTQVVGRDVACDPNHFYRHMTNPLTVSQMKKVVNTTFDFALAGEPTYLHCSGGKDRVGISVLLLLTVMGASKDAILEDYLETNVAREANIQAMFQRFYGFCHDEERAWEITREHAARPENLQAFYEAVDDNWGSMDSFVRNQLGISAEQQELIRSRCTQAATN